MGTLVWPMRFAVKDEYLASKLPADELCDQGTGGLTSP